jgi:hypothetical protein
MAYRGGAEGERESNENIIMNKLSVNSVSLL